MSDSDRIRDVLGLLRDHVSSPSLSHIRDREMLWRLATKIVKAADGTNSIWEKWTGLRESILKPAIFCWIPVEDLQERLNRLPGAPLTLTDVSQRIRSYQDEDYFNYPDQEFKKSCLAIYEAEKATGTELIAIIQAINEYLETETENRRIKRDEDFKKKAQEERLALEQKFLSGADCKWTTLGKSTEFYCRKNGRAFKIFQNAEKMWISMRIESADNQNGDIIGKYKLRGDASKVINQLAYLPD